MSEMFDGAESGDQWSVVKSGAEWSTVTMLTLSCQKIGHENLLNKIWWETVSSDVYWSTLEQWTNHRTDEWRTPGIVMVAPYEECHETVSALSSHAGPGHHWPDMRHDTGQQFLCKLFFWAGTCEMRRWVQHSVFRIHSLTQQWIVEIGSLSEQ